MDKELKQALLDFVKAATKLLEVVIEKVEHDIEEQN